MHPGTPLGPGGPSWPGRPWDTGGKQEVTSHMLPEVLVKWLKRKRGIISGGFSTLGKLTGSPGVPGNPGNPEGPCYEENKNAQKMSKKKIKNKNSACSFHDH